LVFQISIGCHFPPSLPNPGIFVFIPLIRTAGRQEAHGSVAHLVCGVVVIHNEWQNRQDSNPSSASVGSGPQNNVETLLVSVSEFEPQALFQGCTCTGFSLDHLKFISKNPQKKFFGFNAESILTCPSEWMKPES
jgi:hypothetical protein